jgi:phytanoyl-CoA hydroxylase
VPNPNSNKSPNKGPNLSLNKGSGPISASTTVQAAAFARDGMAVVRGFLEPERCAELRGLVVADLEPVVGPAEFEADVGYPGAPESREALGGNTPRRLLSAYARAVAYRELATGTSVAEQLQALQASPEGVEDPWMLSQCHHNCVMTKYPSYSSATLWHQDIRYWSFDVPELISMWVALGEERNDNGALRLIPGSHAIDIDRGRLDRNLFLRPELTENQSLIAQAQVVELEPGDALFFHCRAFHAAGPNRAVDPKLSCVFTYHRQSNQAIPGTRSATYPSVPVLSEQIQGREPQA